MEKKSKMRLIKITGVAIFNLICIFSVIYCLTMNTDKQAVGADTTVKVIDEFEGPKKEINQVMPHVIQTALQPAAQQSSSQTAVVAQGAPQTAIQQRPVRETQAAAQPSFKPIEKSIIIDNFEGEDTRNELGSRANVYVRAPSKVMIAKRDEVINGRKSKALMIKYDKKNTGGPNGMGGWCGYYTLIKNEKTGQYLDGSGYKYITFWVRGEKGDENFMVGLADEHWDKIGDSLKSEEIGVYLEKGKVTAFWQKARVPLDIFFLDHMALSAVTINFEADCFSEGVGSGVVLIDDIALEK